MFSHAQTVVVCAGCSTGLCQPTGGRARFATLLCASENLLHFLHLILSLYSLSMIQMPFCVSVSPLWRLQRQKGLKLVRHKGESGSVTWFHIAKLAHTQFEMFWFAKAYDFLNSYPLPHFKPSLVQAYWGLQLQKEAALRNVTGLNRLLKIQVSRVPKRFWNMCRVFSARTICSHVKE